MVGSEADSSSGAKSRSCGVPGAGGAGDEGGEGGALLALALDEGIEGAHGFGVTAFVRGGEPSGLRRGHRRPAVP